MAFTSTASCSATRSAIYTGLHTHENGQYGLNNNRHHFTNVGSDAVYPWQIREKSTTRNIAWVANRSKAFFRKAKEAYKPFFLTVRYIDLHRDLTRS